MGTTPILRLPYPEDADTPNVPRDIKALAMAVEGVDSVGQEIIVIDPNEADFGWNDFPRGSTSGDTGYSGTSQNYEWRVLNAAARWKWTAPVAGLLHVSTYIHFGYNDGPRALYPNHQDLYQDLEVISGSANATHPDYVRNRMNPYKEEDATQIIDWTGKLVSNFLLTAGSEVSPFVAWKGRTRNVNWSGHAKTWRPKWSGGRMQAFFIPGRVREVNAPAHNVGGPRPTQVAVYTNPDPADQQLDYVPDVEQAP